MTTSPVWQPDPKLDLVIERTIDVPPELVWTAWTRPEHISKWFTPAPWTVTECEIDLRPGGIFRTVMRSPEGEEAVNLGCYLEIVPNQRLVWSDALLAGFRPSPHPFMTAIMTFERAGNATRYTAMAVHRDQATRDRHEEMGFYDGWGTVTDQLAALVKTL
ncbi:polyketide cyclase [Oleomonas cavernae]|uniref:Polyketide cyclase n=1 Tax=Oleomonas cavernae TaxID=2320859 RepID=A0A418WA00_9PROT|nr:SRPBCC family protein [Oleomonas cavernae]RJF86842.1 polyketide cyclase [Oleomonas cavernae]